MAATTVQNDTAASNQSATSVEAFKRAFEEFRRLDGGVKNMTDTLEYEISGYAWSGAQQVALTAFVQSNDEAARAALVALSQVQMYLEGFFSHNEPDEDEAECLRSIRSALTNIWRYHDRNGATALRSYAHYVGAPEKSDLVAWQSQGYQIIGGSLMRSHPEG